MVLAAMARIPRRRSPLRSVAELPAVVTEDRGMARTTLTMNTSSSPSQTSLLRARYPTLTE